MNRRSFIGTLSALLASPALPAFAAPIPPAHMATARIIARSHNRCTLDMLIRHLRVAPDMAARIQAQLLRQGVITPPVAGISLATDPTNTACITNEAMTPTNLVQKAAKLREKLKEFAELTDGEAEPDGDPDQALLIRTESRSNNPSTS